MLITELHLLSGNELTCGASYRSISVGEPDATLQIQLPLCKSQPSWVVRRRNAQR